MYEHVFLNSFNMLCSYRHPRHPPHPPPSCAARQNQSSPSRDARGRARTRNRWTLETGDEVDGRPEDVPSLFPIKKHVVYTYIYMISY